MLRRCLAVVSVFWSLVSSAQGANSPALLQVDEAGVHLRLLPVPYLELPLINHSQRVLGGTLQIELVSRNGKAAVLASRAFRQNPGTGVERISCGDKLPSNSPSELGWYRLRYTVSPNETGASPFSGVIQLERTMVDAFEVNLIGGRRAVRGGKYPIRVRVNNPSTGAPHAGVPVDLWLNATGDDDEDSAIVHRVVTNANGYATHVFDLSSLNDTDESFVSATAYRGALREHAYIDFQFPTSTRITLSTDKPIYQPGQTVHMRGTAFAANGRALRDGKITLEISNDEYDEVFRTELATSRFGVVASDWQIPRKLRLGDYTVKAELEAGEGHESSTRQANIRISRYELPQFAVTVKPDRTYYLPGQDATIEVNADYLFGKPVNKGKVRVVRSNDRHWDSEKQEWVADESLIQAGDLDSRGKFVAHLPLAADFKDFEQQARDDRFRDLTLAAYVTDPSTARTEQRRFTLRLSRHAVHLYLIGPQELSNDQPLTIYLTSSYADGAPARVSGEVTAQEPNSAGDFDENADGARQVRIARFRTNRYGIAKLEISQLSSNLLLAENNRWRRYYRKYSSLEEVEEGHRARILLRAVDEKGRSGNQQAEISVPTRREYLKVEGDHTLYRPGDVVELSLRTNAALQEAIINIAGEKGLLVTERVRIRDGRASLNVPSDSRFRGELSVVAYGMKGSAGAESLLSSSRYIIFPSRQELQVGVQARRTTFRPGETATANVQVNNAEGRPVESALGVLIFDRAVAERVRTDQQFGKPYGFSIFDYLDYRYGESIHGISYRDLLNWDNSAPFPEGLDLLAETLAGSISIYWWDWSVVLGGSADHPSGPAEAYPELIKAAAEPVQKALDRQYNANKAYPHNTAELRRILGSQGIDLGQLRDPWDLPYRGVFSANDADDVMDLVSNGIDKQPGTRDDFSILTLSRAYFRDIGEQIDAVTVDYQTENAKYVRDYETLRRELQNRKGINLDSLRDPWGNAYCFTFQVQGPYHQIQITSAGPDRLFDGKPKRSWDDVHEWTSSLHYFLDETATISKALAIAYAQTGKFPDSEQELKPILDSAKLPSTWQRDPWGNPYHFAFSEQSRYWDRVDVNTVSVYPEQPRPVAQVTPVTQKLAYINVMSYGPENKATQAFSVAEFSRVIAEQAAKDIKMMASPTSPPLAAGKGALSGTITDQSGAVIANARLTLKSSTTGLEFQAQTNNLGAYEFRDVPSGIYTLQAVAPGFRQSTVLRIPVQYGGRTTVSLVLQIGASETVEVTADSLTLETTSSLLSAVSPRDSRTPLSQEALSTPRVRQYFPETLLWSPEVITDKRGRARLSFPMADNITAWKMSVIASDEQGRVGLNERELKTFQPFFLEHEPPKVLTQGDIISLPVVLRNYTSKPQALEAEMNPENWFSSLSPSQQRVTVLPNADASAIFRFRADARTEHGRQRVTARNSVTGDAVERVVAVHPDGDEITVSTAALLAGKETRLEVPVPQNAVPDSTDAELRVYPNLTAHVLDAMSGIGQLPAGCAEQITSGAYVNLFALKLLKKAGQDDPSLPSNPRRAMARDIHDVLLASYQQLVELQAPDGGFRYFRKLESDTGLTAYVLRFLLDTREFIAVDERVVADARSYLLSEQQKSGAWVRMQWNSRTETLGEQEDANLTAYVARALASSPGNSAIRGDQAKLQQAEAGFAKAIAYLDDQIDSWQDPYLVGNYSIAAVTKGRSKYLARARNLLVSLAHDEGSGTYWNLEANTSPFYGWGFAGRVETTALAVEALSGMRQSGQVDVEIDRLVNRGLHYLLHHKDRYFCWYSTQATQNVVEAIVAALPSSAEQGEATTAVVLVNGKSAGKLNIPPATEVSGPVVLDLAGVLANGNNTIELALPGPAAAMDAEILTSYYVPWSDSAATPEQNVKTGGSRALALKVSFANTDSKLGESVICRVTAERVGFRGYGMMLAEIGLPPGAEVDREFLDKAGIGAYEVQPDRVLFYLWPQAGGSSFDFKFKSRYRLDALTQPSVLYDYYNPDARAKVMPVRFNVR